MTIRTKLALGLFAIALVLLVPLLMTRRALGDLHERTRHLQQNEFRALRIVGNLRTGVDRVRDQERLLNAWGTVEAAGSTRDSTRDSLTALVARLADSAATLRGTELEGTAGVVSTAMRGFLAALPGEYHALVVHDTGRADQLSDSVLKPAIDRADGALRDGEIELRDRMGTLVRQANDEQGAAEDRARLALVVATVLALTIAVLLWRSIARPIRDLEAGMAAVAAGNFNHRLRVSPDRGDEFGRLAASFRTMTEQLTQLDQLKAEFVSVASHELKTPINVILGYVQLLQESVYGAVTPKQREILKTLEAQGRGLAKLVHQLLDVSRFEAGGAKLDLRPVELDRFLNDLERTFRVLSIQRGIDFRIERNGELPAEVVWDPDRMNEVMGNLLSNAFKFTERDGTVELVVDGIDGDVHIAVRDSGAGIPEAQLPHVFDKFYQANNQGAASHAGTGLGLAIAQQIVKAHNGTICCESTVGVGTTFTITMPIRAGARLSGAQRPLASGVPA